MINNDFTLADLGAAVVYNMPSGASVSARITAVYADTTIWIRFAVPCEGISQTVLDKKDWHRLTRFPKGSLFCVA